MKLSFIGIGNVGLALAHNLSKSNHDIIIGSENDSSETVQKAMRQNAMFRLLPIQEAIDESDIIFLAVPFEAVKEIMMSYNFTEKIIIDCTNPVGPGISHSLNSTISGSEMIQQYAPGAFIVKAFTIYGYENLSAGHFAGAIVKPAMMIAGNLTEAKDKVAKLIEDAGFTVVDTGGLDQALHLEHLTLLWVKMVRRDGHHPYFVWSYLEAKPKTDGE